ncbi:alginate lyase family protein [Chondrinema litorale]|uniref:alginate lyase family protein n=1 Tax=Chondrinema litorale TaxID=2994555 RepID=UPI002542A26B|nr:alginate lyase family protein [Chondrinema litorale]UZS00187.1 alginate lyase family protein [Chondrinema litorale]
MEHPKEDFYRLKQFIQHQVLDKIINRDTVLKKYKNFTFKKSIKPIYSLETLNDFLSENFDYQTFKVYDHTITDIISLDNWHGDIKNNINPPSGFTHKIPFQNFNKAGDFRYISVVSRFHHFPIYAALSLVNPTHNYEQILKDQLHNWNTQNPFLYSINWRSGIEIGIRSINLLFTRFFIRDKELIRLIDDLMILNYHFLINHMSLYSSANNHLLAELTAIFLITTYYQFNKSDTWNKKSFQLLLEELFKQTHEDGFTKEQSSHYHAEVLNMYLLVFSTAQKHQIDIPIKAKQQIGNMAEFLHYILNEEGTEVLPLGDSDEGELLFPFFDQDYNIYSSVLTDTALILNTKKYLGKDKRFDFRNYLIQQDTGYKQFLLLQNQTDDEDTINLQTKLFKHSGYCFFIENKSKLCFDVGEIGLGKLAAHGHSDLLHFTLDYNDHPFIIDPGTYQYHEKYKFWRNYFRGINAHNTISVDDANHAQAAGRMIWLQHPKLHSLEFTDNNKQVYCSASHNAFLSKSGVVHNRKILYDKKDKFYTITDTLECSNTKTIKFALHFHPSLKVIHEKASIILINPNNLRVIINNNYFSVAKLYKGDIEKPLGWFSNQFNVKNPTTSLLLELEIEGTTSLITNIYFH